MSRFDEQKKRRLTDYATLKICPASTIPTFRAPKGSRTATIQEMEPGDSILVGSTGLARNLQTIAFRLGHKARYQEVDGGFRLWLLEKAAEASIERSKVHSAVGDGGPRRELINKMRHGESILVPDQAASMGLVKIAKDAGKWGVARREKGGYRFWLVDKKAQHVRGDFELKIDKGIPFIEEGGATKLQRFIAALEYQDSFLVKESTFPFVRTTAREMGVELVGRRHCGQFRIWVIAVSAPRSPLPKCPLYNIEKAVPFTQWIKAHIAAKDAQQRLLAGEHVTLPPELSANAIKKRFRKLGISLENVASASSPHTFRIVGAPPAVEKTASPARGQRFYPIERDVPIPKVRRKHGEWVRTARNMRVGNIKVLKGSSEATALANAAAALGRGVSRKRVADGFQVTLKKKGRRKSRSERISSHPCAVKWCVELLRKMHSGDSVLVARNADRVALDTASRASGMRTVSQKVGDGFRVWRLR